MNPAGSKTNGKGKHRRLWFVVTLIAAMILIVGGLFALKVLKTPAQSNIELCHENMTCLKLGLNLYNIHWQNGEAPDLELPRMFDTVVDGGVYLVGGRNPYTGDRVKYIPFEAPPSPGDVTGYMAEVVLIKWQGVDLSRGVEVVRDYEQGYYLYMYGPEGQPGEDIDWDGIPDGVKLCAKPGFACPVGKMWLQEPLDVILDRNGIAHGPAPDSFAQCIWGKPCISAGEFFMGSPCVDEEGRCLFCGRKADGRQVGDDSPPVN
jgi:hypothetical protein